MSNLFSRLLETKAASKDFVYGKRNFFSFMVLNMNNYSFHNLNNKSLIYSRTEHLMVTDLLYVKMNIKQLGQSYTVAPHQS